MDFRHHGGPCCQQVGRSGCWVDFSSPATLQAFRRDGGTIFPHRYSAMHRNRRFHHRHLDNEARSSLCCSVCVFVFVYGLTDA
jgi:hypothetical protein